VALPGPQLNAPGFQPTVITFRKQALREYDFLPVLSALVSYFLTSEIPVPANSSPVGDSYTTGHADCSDGVYSPPAPFSTPLHLPTLRISALASEARRSLFLTEGLLAPISPFLGIATLLFPPLSQSRRSYLFPFDESTSHFPFSSQTTTVPPPFPSPPCPPDR